MTPSDIDRVFGRGRLRMVTGEHVEVYREASLPGERRRYTKRFLATEAGDFRHWTEREWRILARLVGHGIGPVPDVVQFDRGAADRPALVQTYDAGVTVDHWATLLPVERDGMVLRHVFEDCAHWWALARHCLIALDAIHELRLVHLDLKADNVCIPFGPPDFEPRTGQVLSPRFDQIALIDFAFSLVSGESLTRALPIVRQTEYDYQSPRLLQALEAGSRGDLMPTRQLDWRCDVFSLAAMLRRYLPDPDSLPEGSWTHARLAQARAMVRRLLAAHDAEWSGQQRPHVEMLALSEAALADPDLALSLTQGWTLSLRSEVIHTECATPVTRIAAPVSAETHADQPAILRLDGAREERASARRWTWLAAAASVAAIGAPPLYEAWWEGRERVVSRAAPESAPVQAKAASLPGPSRDSVVSEATASTGVGVAVPAPRDRAARPNAASARGVAEARRTPPELAQRSAGASTAVGSAPDPGKPVVSASASPAPATAPVPAAAAMAESPAPRRPAAPAPAAVPSTARAAAPPVRAPTALAKVDRGAKAAAREPEPAAARPTASAGAAPTTDRERALAWLTARGPTPRQVLALPVAEARVIPPSRQRLAQGP